MKQLPKILSVICLMLAATLPSSAQKTNEWITLRMLPNWQVDQLAVVQSSTDKNLIGDTMLLEITPGIKEFHYDVTVMADINNAKNVTGSFEYASPSAIHKSAETLAIASFPTLVAFTLVDPMLVIFTFPALIVCGVEIFHQAHLKRHPRKKDDLTNKFRIELS